MEGGREGKIVPKVSEMKFEVKVSAISLVLKEVMRTEKGKNKKQC